MKPTFRYKDLPTHFQVCNIDQRTLPPKHDPETNTPLDIVDFNYLQHLTLTNKLSLLSRCPQAGLHQVMALYLTLEELYPASRYWDRYQFVYLFINKRKPKLN